MRKILYLGLIILSAALGWFWAEKHLPVAQEFVDTQKITAEE